MRRFSKREAIRAGGLVVGLVMLVALVLTSYAQAGSGDKRMARELWQKIQKAKYRSWATVPGKGTMYRGQPPHGKFLSTYLNPEAVKGMKSKKGVMPEDAIIVKENYKPNRQLAAVTVMYKEPGYDPMHGDWFWTKFKPDGGILKAGKPAGCISCHGSVRSNDYIFTFPIAPIKP
ncbi:MAG: cytochrome P460 family protein [bacterium]